MQSYSENLPKYPLGIISHSTILRSLHNLILLEMDVESGRIADGMAKKNEEKMKRRLEAAGDGDKELPQPKKPAINILASLASRASAIFLLLSLSDLSRCTDCIRWPRRMRRR
jgi:hypothetical protein